MLLKICTDCLALSFCMLILTSQVVKLHFRGASQNPLPFLSRWEFLLEILQVSYQIIVLNTCQIGKSSNNINIIKHVKTVCCIFNGTQCICSTKPQHKTQLFMTSLSVIENAVNCWFVILFCNIHNILIDIVVVIT